MTFRIHALFLFVLFASAACRNQPADGEKQRPVAKAGSEELSQDGLRELLVIPPDTKDSAAVLKQSIERWAVDALFYQEALTKLEAGEADVEKQVENYRKALVSHIYQTRIIEANLDTNVSRQEIESYYNENKNSFMLKDNIVKVDYFKIPLKEQALDKMKRLFYAVMPKEKEQLRSLAAQYAENFFVNDSTWLYLDDIRKEIPRLKDQDNLSIYPGKVLELSDEQFYYFLRIRDVKIKNSLSPLNFEISNIKNFIINRRKTQLIEQYRQQLLEKARTQKTFTVY